MGIVREAQRSDVGRCAELLGILFGQEHEFVPDAQKQRRGLEMIMEEPGRGTILVYEEEGIIWGMVLLLFTVSTALGAKVAILEDMIVAPAARGKGVGGRLIEEAVAFAARNGLARITLLTDHDNEAAQKFYLKSGFTKSEMVVLRRFPSL